MQGGGDWSSICANISALFAQWRSMMMGPNATLLLQENKTCFLCRAPGPVYTEQVFASNNPFVTAQMLFDIELPKMQISENRLQSEIFDNGCVNWLGSLRMQRRLGLLLVQQPCVGRGTTNKNGVLPGYVCAHDSDEFIKASSLIM